MPVLKGHTVSHYKILDQIGCGGMGVVYKAQDLTLDRTVALKFLNPVYSCSEDFKSRFLREARAASSLDHPNICTVYEVGETEDEQMFLAMAHYEGVTLEERVSGGPLPFDEATSVAVQVCLGLAAAHEKGIVHRDIKTGNVILATGGRVKIMDFGLAKFPGRSQITAENIQLGTLAFMSPEQARGGEADRRSDIWSLGVMLYQMVTGRLPFYSEYDQALVYAIINETPAAPNLLRPEIPKNLEQIILRCLQKDPDERYQSAAEIADALLQASQALPRSAIGRRLANVPTWMMTSAVMLGALLLLFFLFRPRTKQQSIKSDAIVLDVHGTGEQSPGYPDITPDMVDFLISDEFLQSTNMEVYSREEFRRQYPGAAPALDFEVSLEGRDVGYQLHVNVRLPDESSELDRSYPIHDPSAVLTQLLPDLRKRMIAGGSLGNIKPSRLTDSWDAFTRFFYGFRAWTRYEITKAKENLEAAIAIDSNFALSKLRLAEVYQWEQNFVLARSLLESIRPSLSLLSKVDSLRAEALDARIARDFWREVSRRREIYDTYPLRKESPLDVAEAYFQLCDIPDAMAYYKKALALDPNLAGAYNHLGYCYSHLGQHESALAAVRKYVQLDSTANAFDSMGDFYMAAGYLDSAASTKERGITLEPGLSYLYRALAYIRLRQGRLHDADSAAATYLRHVSTPELKSQGLTLRAFVAYARKDYRGALKYCRKALDTFDSPDLETRLAELHWLHSLVNLEIGDIATAQAEMREMERLLRERNANNSTNYMRGFYKYSRHLQACLAARNNNVQEVLEVARELDGPLHDKVKDQTSPFDYAFLSTELGQLLASPPLNSMDLAERRFELALVYNPRYAPARYNLWKLYAKQGDVRRGEEEMKAVRELWKNADPEFRTLLGLPD